MNWAQSKPTVGDGLFNSLSPSLSWPSSPVVMSSFSSAIKRYRRGSASIEEEEDRISALPEALIVDILSLLATRVCIRTGALSRRWRYLWTLVPKLHFTDENRTDEHVFVKNVNRMLILRCGGSNVKDFQVEMHYLSCYEPDVSAWCRFASLNEIDKFGLLFYPWDCGEFYTLPQLLYGNSCFKELKFRYCNVVPRVTVSWKSLKKLSISEARLSNDDLQKILAGSPALEILHLGLDRGIYHFHLGNSAIKELKVFISDSGPVHDGEESMLVVSAPNVQSLLVSGCFRTCSMVDMASLVEASLFCCLPVEYPVLSKQLVCSLANVETLTLDSWVIQGIPKLMADNVLPSLLKCKCLTIVTALWETEPNAIASLLNITPKLETLAIDADLYNTSQLLDDSAVIHDNSSIAQFWTFQEATSGYLTHLRTVKFDDFWVYRIHAFSFVRFVLKNGKVLEKMIINLGRTGICNNVVPMEVFETSQKLLSFPRSSPDAEVLVHL